MIVPGSGPGGTRHISCLLADSQWARLPRVFSRARPSNDTRHPRSIGVPSGRDFVASIRGIPRPVRIDYTGWEGPSGQSLPPANRVDFNYESRVDQLVGYESHAASWLDSRLKSIVATGNGQFASKVVLVYGTSARTSRSILQRVERYDSATATTPVLTSTLGWVQGANGFEPDAAAGSQADGYAPNSGGFKLADVNGDGRADFIYASSRATRVIQVMLGTDTGFGPEQTWGVHTSNFNANALGFRMADVNGDGLADVVYDSNASNKVYVLLSTGRSFAADTAWGTRTLSYDTNCFGGFRMADVNGDGMADFVYAGLTGWDPSVQVLLSTGSGFLADQLWQSIDNGYKSGSRGFHLGDVNGTGLPQVVYNNPGTNNNLRLLKSRPFPDLLQTVQNGLGGTYGIAYRPSSRYANRLLPYVVQTVAAITADPGTGSGSIQTTHYTYSGGYHHLGEREFRGFETVTQSHDPAFLAPSTTRFHQTVPGTR